MLTLPDWDSENVADVTDVTSHGRYWHCCTQICSNITATTQRNHIWWCKMKFLFDMSMTGPGLWVVTSVRCDKLPEIVTQQWFLILFITAQSTSCTVISKVRGSYCINVFCPSLYLAGVSKDICGNLMFHVDNYFPGASWTVHIMKRSGSVSGTSNSQPSKTGFTQGSK